MMILLSLVNELTRTRELSMFRDLKSCFNVVFNLCIFALPFITGGLNIEGEADSWDFGVGVLEQSISFIMS